MAKNSCANLTQAKIENDGDLQMDVQETESRPSLKVSKSSVFAKTKSKSTLQKSMLSSETSLSIN